MTNLVNSAKELYLAIQDSEVRKGRKKAMENVLLSLIDCFLPYESAEYDEFKANQLMTRAYLTESEMIFVKEILNVENEVFEYRDYNKMYLNIEFETNTKKVEDGLFYSVEE